MSQIGEPERFIVAEPVFEPVPEKEPVEQPQRIEKPEPEPVRDE